MQGLVAISIGVVRCGGVGFIDRLGENSACGGVGIPARACVEWVAQSEKQMLTKNGSRAR
jgi:hypothetical protein